MLVLGLVFPCVACDQATKAIARQVLESGRPVELLGGFVCLHLVENPGAFLSLGESLPDGLRLLIFVVLAPLGLALVAMTLLRSGEASPLGICAVALILGGGLGNLIDRLVNQGAVVDFVHIGIGSVRTGVFNVADVALMVGVALFVVAFRSGRGDPSPPGKGAGEADAAGSGAESDLVG